MKTISPIIVSVFAIYLTIGVSLGILPGFVTHDLGFDSFAVGLVIGMQSLATLLTRGYAGKLTDTKGTKRSNHIGIALGMLSGIVYLIAASLKHNPLFALSGIVLARIIHGISESLAVTSALTWGIGLVGPQRSGKVMTWNGIAMYAGIALGAPLAIWLKNWAGENYVFALMIVLSGISWVATFKLRVLPIDAAQGRTPFYKVIGQVAGQGLGLAFSSIGFACISSFVSLLFTSKNWGSSSIAYMVFGGCYILVRVVCSSLPDRFGGYKVAMVSLIVEVAGQITISLSSSSVMAIAGCGMTGIGFSLIFPSLGVIAIKKIVPQMRGTALAAYAAFFDLSLGLAAPSAGIIAGRFNLQAVYWFGAISCILAISILFFTRDYPPKSAALQHGSPAPASRAT